MRDRSTVESELYAATKDTIRVTDEDLARVVAGEQFKADPGPRADVAFPDEEAEDVLG